MEGLLWSEGIKVISELRMEVLEEKTIFTFSGLNSIFIPKFICMVYDLKMDHQKEMWNYWKNINMCQSSDGSPSPDECLNTHNHIVSSIFLIREISPFNSLIFIVFSWYFCEGKKVEN